MVAGVCNRDSNRAQGAFVYRRSGRKRKVMICERGSRQLAVLYLLACSPSENHQAVSVNVTCEGDERHPLVASVRLSASPCLKHRLRR